MPRGAPLNHIRTWFKTINQHPTLEQLILVMDRSYPITKTFMNLAVKVFYQKRVDTVGEALALAQDAIES
jgi:hypothetical protein